jgi:hypothetical protein
VQGMQLIGAAVRMVVDLNIVLRLCLLQIKKGKKGRRIERRENRKEVE